MTISRFRAVFMHDFYNAEFISAFMLVCWGTLNFIWPPSPFKLQFLEPLLRLTDEQTWDGISIACGLFQFAALYNDDKRLRYLAAWPGAVLFGSLMASMFETSHAFPARMVLHGTGAIVNFIAIIRHTSGIWPRARAAKA